MNDDELGAFSRGPATRLAGVPGGPLSGLSFAAKENFDIAGRVTRGGNPDWERTHEPAAETAPAIRALLAAGASLTGTTQMDELAWGALGVNEHDGIPVNPAAPGRVPGGSSSGSASAVAGGLVDFALGTDSACSVRLPAAFCGIFGFRPTLGHVSVDGVIPLSASLDTVGWFARDAELLERVGSVLLGSAAEPIRPTTLLVASDAFALADRAIAAALEPAVERVAPHFRERRTETLIATGLEQGLAWLWYRAWQVEMREAWAHHGHWITQVRPRSRVLSRETFAVAADSTAEDDAQAAIHFRSLRAAIRKRVPAGRVVCIPTAAALPPPRPDGASPPLPSLLLTFCLMSIAGIAGLPQVTIPGAKVDGVPVGLSFVGWQGSDESLLGLARALTA